MLRFRSSLVLLLSLDKYAGMHNYQALPEHQKWLVSKMGSRQVEQCAPLRPVTRRTAQVLVLQNEQTEVV